MNNDLMNRILEETVQELIQTRSSDPISNGDQTALSSIMNSMMTAAMSFDISNTDISSGIVIPYGISSNANSLPYVDISNSVLGDFSSQGMNLDLNEQRDYYQEPEEEAEQEHEPDQEPEPQQSRSSGNNTQISLQERYIDLVDDFISRWFRHIREYQENVRIYQTTVSQINRMTQQVMRNISNIDHILHASRLRRNSNRYIPQTNTMYNGGSRNTNVPSTLSNIFGELNTTTPQNTRIRNTPLLPFLFENRLNNGQLESEISATLLLSQDRNNATIYPTIIQILSSTERFLYRSRTPDTETNVTHTRCPITLEDFEEGEELCKIIHCGHTFKWISLQGWFSRNAHCPVCRYDIRTYVPSV